MTEEQTLLVDASVFITLTEVRATDALLNAEGEIVVPEAVEREITCEPAASALVDAVREDHIEVRDASEAPLLDAAGRLGHDVAKGDGETSGSDRLEGDVALLALAMSSQDPEVPRSTPSPVVVTDDKPLRQTCKALSMPVSGSIGVLIRAVERGDLNVDEAKDTLYAMDEVGARLSASLVRRAERLIDDAADE